MSTISFRQDGWKCAARAILGMVIQKMIMNGKMSIVFVDYHKIYRFKRMQQKCIMEMEKKEIEL